MNMKKLCKILPCLLASVALASCGGETTSTSTSGNTSGSSTTSTFDKTKDITVCVRPSGSGTKGAFMEIIGIKGHNDPAGALSLDNTSAIFAMTAKDTYAIAYDSLGYVDKGIEDGQAVKKLTVGGVEATAANVKDGSYTISRPLNVLYQASKMESNEIMQDYLKFLNSTQVQTLAADGYVAIHDDATEYTAPTTALSGTLSISGSTSLQPLMTTIAAEYMKLNTGVTVTVAGGGSGTGSKNAQNGTSDFGMISREFDSTQDGDTTCFTVAKDGIAIIVNADNPYTNITIDQLKGIYDGDNTTITKWNQLD